MSGDYLWDKSGQPDPAVERLENVLGVLGNPRPLDELQLQPSRRFSQWWPHAFAFAAAAIALVAVLWFVRRELGPDCIVVRVEGAPKVGSKELSDSGRLRVGDWLVTDERSRATISMGRIARVDVEPNTSLQLIRFHRAENRLSLRRGKLHASIWAPPRLFFVDTPSGVAIDLGCVYTLAVDSEGNTQVEVNHGLVSIEAHGRESFIPGGAICVARRSLGPGTPYYGDATPILIGALNDFDLHPSAEAVQTVLAQARKKDALTLWHLIARTGGSERAAVIEKMATLTPLPPE